MDHTLGQVMVILYTGSRRAREGEGEGEGQSATTHDVMVDRI
jgi:hypothetical protein